MRPQLSYNLLFAQSYPCHLHSLSACTLTAYSVSLDCFNSAVILIRGWIAGCCARLVEAYVIICYMRLFTYISWIPGGGRSKLSNLTTFLLLHNSNKECHIIHRANYNIVFELSSLLKHYSTFGCMLRYNLSLYVADFLSASSTIRFW